MLPSSYNPIAPEQFIGPARHAALQLDRLIELARPDSDPLRVILTGSPGIGKTKLANYFTARLGGTRWNTDRFNGAEVTVEQVESLVVRLAYRDLFGAYRVLQIEEIDKMPPVARSRMLTFCDDMPAKTALIATTNLSPDKMKATNPATQRRYTWIELDPPTEADIFAMLRRHWPSIGESSAREIAVMACGCVGWALQEADAWLANTVRLEVAA
jgi:replication-associated recombination protein RarA